VKIVILAAGIGSRLGNPFPKPLTPLNNGKTIMGMQIHNLRGHFSIDNIQVVVGFKKDLSVLWLNGDVVFDGDLINLLKPYIEKQSSFVAVNTSKVAEEEVKYTLKNGFVDELSKTVKNGLGEAVGINFIDRKRWSANLSCRYF